MTHMNHHWCGNFFFYRHCTYAWHKAPYSQCRYYHHNNYSFATLESIATDSLCTVCLWSHLPAHSRAWTRPGCTPVSQCPYTAVAVTSGCSKIEYSGQQCRPQRQAGRAGGETRQWLSLQPGDPCRFAPGSARSGSTPAAERTNNTLINEYNK